MKQKLVDFKSRGIEERLAELLKNPEILDQKNTNLCGVVVGLKIILESSPESFEEMVYTLSKGKNHRGIFPNHKAFKETDHAHLPELDYLLLTSIRYSMNYFLGYIPAKDKGFHGFTWPGDIKWLLQHFQIRAEPKLVFRKQATVKIAQALEKKERIIGLFDWKCLQENKRSFNQWHYIQIVSLKQTEDKIILGFWNPNGGIQTELNVNKKQFLSAFWMWWRIPN
jgi:hypothetical protein